MGYKGLFIWVEGTDDVEFFARIIKPHFDEVYDWVNIVPHADKSSEYITRFIHSIEAMRADYIFVADINSAPCVTELKQQFAKSYKNLEKSKVVVVIKEIESWYLAGLTEVNAESLGLPIFTATNDVTKEQFNSLIPKKFDSRIDFMVEILKRFSVDIAKQKNQSFSYFVEKYIK